MLTSESYRDLFEWINKRCLCKGCKNERSKFCTKDKNNHACRSNLIPGFYSKNIVRSIDILIVAEAHGGGRDEDYHEPQLPVDEEVSYIANYYLTDKVSKFHQWQMRELLEHLNKAGKSWVFTDLIKCFVWHGKDKSLNLKGSDNKKKAIKHCRKYLDEQIKVLQPRKILVLGQTVGREYFRLKGLKSSNHGRVYPSQIDNVKTTLVYSVFPSQITADIWAEKGGWELVIEKLTSH